MTQRSISDFPDCVNTVYKREFSKCSFEGEARMNKRDRAIVGQENSISPVTCTHHWIIATNYGPTSLGHCKKCGAQREFNNLFQAFDNIENSSRRNNKVVLSGNL